MHDFSVLTVENYYAQSCRRNEKLLLLLMLILLLLLLLSRSNIEQIL